MTEREQFEAWATTQRMATKFQWREYSRSYYESHLEPFWRGWMARAELDAAIGLIPHTLAGFEAAFYSLKSRKPTLRETWDAGIKSWRDLNPPTTPQPTLRDVDIEALAMKYEAFGFGFLDAEGVTTHGFEPDGLIAFVKAIMTIAQKPAPPHECKTEAEKTAYAAGWWDALASKRNEEASTKETP